MKGKTLSNKSTAMKEIETYMGYNREEDKEIINENDRIRTEIINRKMKQYGLK